VAITWSPSDTLTGLINRINTSAAGVRASYDPTSDRFSLTNSATGAQSISLSEDSNSNILEALGLKTATQKYGQVAQYQISTDGGTTFGTMQYSNSNTLSSVMPGVSLSLLSDPGATPSTTTITVGQDTAATQRNLQTFVDGFNALVDAVDQATQYDPTNKKASALTGDSAITGVAAQIRSLVADAALDVNKTLGKYSTLASIGISTGAIGSKPGTTDHLSLDQTKLTAALQDNPLAVQQLLNGLTSTTTLSQGGTQWVSSISGSPTGQLTDASYALSLTYDPNAPPGSISAIKTANGVASPAVTGTIAAGGSNSTLIPGLTINALANPPSGTTAGTTIQYTVQTRGVLQRLNDYLKSAVGSGGVFASEKDSETQESRDIDSQISYQNDLLAQKQAALQAQFTAMEVALSKLNSQSSSLMGSLASLSSSSK
jgi:flagellar hook-associated protein 2